MPAFAGMTNFFTQQAFFNSLLAVLVIPAEAGIHGIPTRNPWIPGQARNDGYFGLRILIDLNSITLAALPGFVWVVPRAWVRFLSA